MQKFQEFWKYLNHAFSCAMFEKVGWRQLEKHVQTQLIFHKFFPRFPPRYEQNWELQRCNLQHTAQLIRIEFGSHKLKE